jgi:protein involved in polysaccharide export with SLBB domain
LIGLTAVSCRELRGDVAGNDKAVERPSANGETAAPAAPTAPDPASVATPAASDTGEGLLRPGLIVSVSVVVGGRKEVDEPSRRVAEDGTINLPMLGAVQVGKLKLPEAIELIAKGYSRFFVKPQVAMDFVSDGRGGGPAPWGTITVLGRVTKPGQVPVPPTRDMTVSGAIQAAGGFAASADEADIRVTLRSGGGEPRALKVNLKKIGTRGEVEQDVVLQAGDVVFVPELLF